MVTAIFYIHSQFLYSTHFLLSHTKTTNLPKLTWKCVNILPLCRLQLKSQLDRKLEEEYHRLPEEICQHLQIELQNKNLQKNALFSTSSNHSSPSTGSGPPSNCSTPSNSSTPSRSTLHRSRDNSTASLADSTSSSTTPVLSDAEMSFN